jgi:hypothetical protein
MNAASGGEWATGELTAATAVSGRSRLRPALPVNDELFG